METLNNLLMESTLLECEKNLREVMQAFKKGLKEDVRDLSGVTGGLDDKFEEAIKRLAAARRGLGLANRLRDPEQKKENQRRIFINMNRLKLLVDGLVKDAQVFNTGLRPQSTEQQMQQGQQARQQQQGQRPQQQARPQGQFQQNRQQPQQQQPMR